MRVLNRALAATAGALVLSGLLPLQGASAADPEPRKLWVFCSNIGNGDLFDPKDRHVAIPGGTDAPSWCRVGYALDDSRNGYVPTDVKLTLSAESVAASGYTAQQLAGMVQVRTGYTSTLGHDWLLRHWTVRPDGSLTLTVPASTGADRSYGGLYLQLTGAPRTGTAPLKATLEPTDPAYAGGKVEVSYDWTGQDGFQPYTPGTPGTFVPMTPARLLDTRQGLGKVGPGRSVGVKIAGVSGVPATGVTAVVLNVTATRGTADSYVTAYPHGAERPTASNLNFRAGQTVPNQVTVPVQGGMVDLYNFAGDVDLIADISGYYLAGDSGQRYNPVAPKRLMDTRSVFYDHWAPVGPGGTVTLDIAKEHPDATAVTLNVTATRSTAGGYVTAYPHGAARPTASNLNFTPGQTVPNQVTVPVRGGKVDLYNFAGNVDLVADLSGYYAATGAAFVPTGPTRVLDTRKDPGKPAAGGKEFDIRPNSWKYGVPPFGVTGVAMNVTVTRLTAPSYLALRPTSGCSWDHEFRPLDSTSNLNFTAGQTVANAVTTAVGPLETCGGYEFTSAVGIYNNAGTVDVIADLSGYFVKD
ncbi:hypothetical protein ABT095_12820 [Kitasatospora sp. NPDC002227]|uniref:hypothetical protein n=1 Tax=Kitasatospora sp. NPDC002227 TaxID=3154773 RepID=UPI0033272E33